MPPKKIQVQPRGHKPVIYKIIRIIVELADTFARAGGKYTSYLCSFDKFHNSFLKNERCEGRTETIRKFKEIYRVAVFVSLGLPFKPLPFTSADKRGIPRLIKPFAPLLQGSVWDKRIALTLLRVYTLRTSSPKPDVSPIVDPQGIEAPDITGFTNFVKDKLSRQDLPESETQWIFGAKSGPNGLSIASSHLDAWALKDAGLAETWSDLANLVRSPMRMSFNNCIHHYQSKPGLNTGKLSFIPEKGGKTRTIAIIDFWTQHLFKGFHSQLMGMLKVLDTDGTYDQDAAFERVLKCTPGKATYSFDLKSATDRFPFYLQKVVLSRLWPKAEPLISKLLTDRSFKMKGVEQQIRWAVGQPLGCYMSWPLFSLTHHLVIQWCAVEVGIRDPFKDYQVLGDDVVIWNTPVANRYQLFMKEHNVPISLEKSIISGSDISAGEFAKRLFLNGQEISPISLHLMNQFGKSIYHFPQLMNQIVSRWKVPSYPSELLALSLLTWIRPKGKMHLQILTGFSAFLKGTTQWPWCGLKEDTSTLFQGLSTYFLNNQAEKIFNFKKTGATGLKVRKLAHVKEKMKEVGLVVPDSLLVGSYDDDFEPHPIVQLVNAKNRKLTEAGINTEGSTWEIAVGEVSSLTDPSIATIKLNRIKPLNDLINYFRLGRDPQVTGKIVLDYYYRKLHSDTQVSVT